jgi:hypothetical protein
MKTPDVLVARLGGAIRADVAVVKTGEKYHFVAPERLGGVQEVPADCLVDCLNWSIVGVNEKIVKARRRRSNNGRAR